MLPQNFICAAEREPNTGDAIAVQELTLTDDVEALLRADSLEII